MSAVQTNDVIASPNAALAPVANTVSRPGYLTTEWYTLIAAGVVSTLVGKLGVSSNSATQVAAVIAPIAVALIYALVRGHTKGALADVLQAAFPQAEGGALLATGAQAGTPGYFTPAGAVLPMSAAALTNASVLAIPTTQWASSQYVPTGDLSGAYWNGAAWISGKAP